MPRVSAGDVRRFHDEIALYKEGARESVSRVVLAAADAAGESPSASRLESIADIAFDALLESVYGTAELVVGMSSEFMEAVAGEAVAPGSLDPLALCEGPDGLRARVQHHMDSLVAGEMSPKDFANRLADCADIEVKNAYARAMDALAPAHAETKWARVPVGNTCEWCVMLGSLGYYFHSARSAARGSHAKCNCLIVPSIGGRAPDIGGYDPDALYMQWVRSVRDEGLRSGRELTETRKHKNDLHRGGWQTANPIEVILNLLPNARRDRSREETSDKLIWVSDRSNFMVLIDPRGGYFRVIKMNNSDTERPFVRYDGFSYDAKMNKKLYLRMTHYLIAGFDHG